jgi:hypothetical protein
MHDPPMLEGPAVWLRGGRHLARTLCFRQAVTPYADAIIDYLVEVHDNGLQVCVGVTSLAGDDLCGFLRELSDSYRGWDGIREKWSRVVDGVS